MKFEIKSKENVSIIRLGEYGEVELTVKRNKEGKVTESVGIYEYNGEDTEQCLTDLKAIGQKAGFQVRKLGKAKK